MHNSVIIYTMVIYIISITSNTQPNTQHCWSHLITACSCGFKSEDEIHFFWSCPLYYRPRVTLLNALAHIAPLTVRTLLYGNDTFEFKENKIIIAETLRFIKESKRFDWCNIYLTTNSVVFNYGCMSFSSFIVNVPYVIILSVSICISSLLVWISINTFKTSLWVQSLDALLWSNRYMPLLHPLETLQWHFCDSTMQ